jgi:predicted nucleic acid-binding protein
MPEVVPTHVLDASIAVKWLLPLADEPHLEKAQEIAADFQDGLINLVSPGVLPYEVGHALGSAVRRQRITAAEARSLFDQFLEWRIPLVQDAALLRSAMQQVSEIGCSFYDGTYVALALRYQYRFLHADDKLRDLLGRAMFLLQSGDGWIGRYLPEPR